jgi:ribosomal protein S27E
VLSENKDNILEVECPKCFEENIINLSSTIKCKHCNEPLIGKKYSKPLISTMTAIIIGAGGGIFLDKKFETDRYPIHIEYNIIDSCLSSHEEPLYRKHYIKKRDICICSLRKTENELDYDDFKKDKN